MFVFGPLPDNPTDDVASELDKEAVSALAGLYTLARAGHAILSSIEAIATRHNLTPAQFRLLMVLRFVHPQGAPMSQVAESLSIRAPSLTELVGSDGDLFVRQGDASDRRQVILTASTEGNRRLDRALPEMAAHAVSLRDRLAATWDTLIPGAEHLFDEVPKEKS
ncbi:MAG: hypothetical protein M3132_02940 [Actinomycetia bacterium]|nr:hypothetical protein [Actinomycetes bacterium]